MNDQQLLRYARHILLNEWGIEGQKKVSAAKVLVIGVGGLGAAACLYLVSAGIGELTLFDHDVVELSNLQRQILYQESDIGQCKVKAAAKRLHQLNSEVIIHAHNEHIKGQALFDAVAGSDIVLDCSDNFSTRDAINRACVQHCKPLVLGAAIRFSGQIIVFDLRQKQAPCYHCLFPDTAPIILENCATMGVFAPLVGVIGSMQAAEALKLVVGTAEGLLGRLLILEGLGMRWREMDVKRDEQCQVCRGFKGI